MPSRDLLLILLSVSLSGLAQACFKLGVSAAPTKAALGSGSIPGIVQTVVLNPAVLGGLAMYGIGTLIWLSVLSRADLSRAYPFVGLSFIITAVLGFWLFHENLGASRILGTGLVIAGVVLIGRG